MGANIKRERDQEGLESSGDAWVINDDLRREIIEAKEAVERSRKEFENQVRPCPFDGSNSRFLRYEGSYTRGWAIFICEEKGDQFQQG